MSNRQAKCLICRAFLVWHDSAVISSPRPELALAVAHYRLHALEFCQLARLQSHPLRLPMQHTRLAQQIKLLAFKLERFLF